MKTKKVILLSLLALGYTDLALAMQQNYASVESIKTINGEEASEFSTYIRFTPNVSTEKDWAFGFYMPRTFNQLVSSSQNINPKLNMQICRIDMERLCYPLALITKPEQAGAEVLPSYYSAGYTNVLTLKNAADRFPLQTGVTYQLELIDNNQWAPGNYSAMPQNLFIIDNYGGDNSVVYNLRTMPDIYHIGGYDQNAVDKAINEHEQTIVQQSMDAPINSFAYQYNMIPSPVSVKAVANKTYQLKDNTLGINVAIKGGKQEDVDQKIAIFKEILSKLGIPLKLIDSDRKNANLRIAQIDEGAINNNPEGYLLNINGDGVEIKANTSTGVLYALISLSQILYHEAGTAQSKAQALSLPYVEIKDYPRFAYRGILLDSARHFFSVGEVKQLLEAMLVQKLNTLHLHFADDEAFRIKLNALSDEASRLATSRGYADTLTNPAEMFGQYNLDKTNYLDNNPQTHMTLDANYPLANTPYNGVYTQEDIQSLIKYANARGITIIPELDAPGHARALIHADPEVFNGEQGDFISVQGYYDDALPVCLYNAKDTKDPTKAQRFTQGFDNIMQELGNLFANQLTIYHQNEVSVGGDEVAVGAWQNEDGTSVKACSNNKWETELKVALADLNEQQKAGVSLALLRSQRFFKEVSKNNPKLKLSGWQQSVQGDDPDGTILPKFVFNPQNAGHLWVWNVSTSGIDQAVNLAKHQYPTVLAYADNTYFDLTYTSDKWEPGFNWATAFSDTFAALQIAQTANITEEKAGADSHNIIGVEGALWSENLYNFKHLSYMALPKSTGLAEAAWAPASLTTDGDKINWLSLKHRLGNQKNGFLDYVHRVSGMDYKKDY